MDYSSFLLLTADLLRDIGVNKIGPRTKIEILINEIETTDKNSN